MWRTVYSIPSATLRSDVAAHTRVVAVVAAMRGQIEGDAQSLLTGGERRSIEGVRLARGGETGVLANRPGTTDVHAGARPAQKGEHPWHRIEIRQAFEI